MSFQNSQYVHRTLMLIKYQPNTNKTQDKFAEKGNKAQDKTF